MYTYEWINLILVKYKSNSNDNIDFYHNHKTLTRMHSPIRPTMTNKTTTQRKTAHLDMTMHKMLNILSVQNANRINNKLCFSVLCC